MQNNLHENELDSARLIMETVRHKQLSHKNSFENEYVLKISEVLNWIKFLFLLKLRQCVRLACENQTMCLPLHWTQCHNSAISLTIKFSNIFIPLLCCCFIIYYKAHKQRLHVTANRSFPMWISVHTYFMNSTFPEQPQSTIKICDSMGWVCVSAVSHLPYNPSCSALYIDFLSPVMWYIGLIFSSTTCDCVSMFCSKWSGMHQSKFVSFCNNIFFLTILQMRHKSRTAHFFNRKLQEMHNQIYALSLLQVNLVCDNFELCRTINYRHYENITNVFWDAQLSAIVDANRIRSFWAISK